MGKKRCYKIIKGGVGSDFEEQFDRNGKLKSGFNPISPEKRVEGSYYTNKNMFSTLEPKDIPQPKGKVFREL